MSANTGNSGVRNLRAIFENKGPDQSTSPPSRGRSPSNSATSGSSRPVSKVRASFVAVERPSDITSSQQWGLRKASDVSSMAEVKETETNDITRTSTVVTENGGSTKSPTSPHTSKHSIDGGLGTILKGSSFEGTPKKQPQESKPAEATSTPANGQPQATTGVGSRAYEMIEKMKSNKNPGPPPPPPTTVVTQSDAKPIKNPHPKPMVKPSPTSPTSPKPSSLDKSSPEKLSSTTTAGPATKPSPMSPRSPKLDISSPKTPTSPPTAKSMVKGGPAKIKGVMESAKKASEAREAVKKEPPRPIQKKDIEIKSARNKQAESQPKPQVNGIKKEAVTSPTKVAAPRSPTRPVKLPAGATSTTTAAAAKRDSTSQAQQPVRKAAPRASLPATQSRATAPTTASSLHTKSSRASLAPNGSDRPKSRVSLSKPDEGFLARMMRPTQSSASKTHEKVQVDSPPRARTTNTRKPRTSSFKGSRKSDQSDSQPSKPDDVAMGPANGTASAPIQVSGTSTAEG